jgi:hypothetical protein
VVVCGDENPTSGNHRNEIRMFVMLFKVLLLGPLIKVIVNAGPPLACSTVYAGALLIVRLILGMSFVTALTVCVTSFLLASVYFVLLDRHEHSGAFWPILFAGFAALLLIACPDKGGRKVTLESLHPFMTKANPGCTCTYVFLKAKIPTSTRISEK